jgi:hypothetical protein
MVNFFLTFRALNTLNNKIDPMPSEVLSECNLCNLFDVSSLHSTICRAYIASL